MDWKVKELKKLLEDKHDEDIVQFFVFDFGSEAYTKLVDVGEIKTRKPKRSEFLHTECKHYVEIPVSFADDHLRYCKRKECTIIMTDEYSCDDFHHKEYNLEYTEE